MSTPFDVEQLAGTPRGWRVLAPLRVREFRLLIAAVSIFIFAEGMWTVVMALQVIALAGDRIAEIHAFLDVEEAFERFGFPPHLD